ncbi:AP2/ERF and B3 domain-containing transcription factor like protein [Tanacetum coccineum]|uniref:AP2/ERF and B3 domain-containing transcription factor like protein n=1 Tax=Tanacetum coccineum TaxID=301880 RepID=A0ABQ5FQN0_9ASTR
MAYDRASIKLRSYDAPRNFPWSQTTDLEAKFQSPLNMEDILKMIKDETYESKFNEFLREKTGKEKDDDLSVQKNCDNFRRLLFEKELTPSDVGKLNRFVIPKKFVVAYFPPVPDNDHSEGFVNDEDLRSPNSGCFEIGTSLPKNNIGASLKLGRETQVKYVESKEDEGIVEDREISDEVIQTSNVETKGFKLFGVQIMTS